MSSWHPDTPDLPIEKPLIIENLEKMDPSTLNSMPPAEIDEMIESIAYNVAKAYKEKFHNGDIKGCIDFVSIALNVTGSSLGGKIGLAMVAGSDIVAKKACHLIYEVNEID
ncbi:MAG: hypothetical protein H0X29_09100 [Parachlamydiaceae bacterium]|nr:hypothetical protein [Parachlamydiaceae bacterium]